MKKAMKKRYEFEVSRYHDGIGFEVSGPQCQIVFDQIDGERELRLAFFQGAVNEHICIAARALVKRFVLDEQLEESGLVT